MIGNIITTDIEEEQVVAEQAIPRQSDGTGVVCNASWLSSEPTVASTTLSRHITGYA